MRIGQIMQCFDTLLHIEITTDDGRRIATLLEACEYAGRFANRSYWNYARRMLGLAVKEGSESAVRQATIALQNAIFLDGLHQRSTQATTAAKIEVPNINRSWRRKPLHRIRRFPEQPSAN